MKIISLGWGVQSWTMAAMVALGELEPVDFAIHSDTTWERSATYKFAKRWTPWLTRHGVSVYTTSAPRKMTESPWDANSNSHIPLYVIGPKGDGQLLRTCTGRWKIRPVRRFVAEELMRRELSKTPGIVEQWIGITLDEWQRVKDSGVKYVKNVFPLVEKKFTRADCILWLRKHDLPSPGKSSCTFCPYHNKAAWEQMKRNNASDWEQAVMVDKLARNEKPPYQLYIHPARRPLPEAVTIPEDFGYKQLSYLESNDFDAECDSGYCFL